ncbi:MAG: methylamine methyltransferase corrinoid protein reductive activase [Methanotrichaceae archaeon]
MGIGIALDLGSSGFRAQAIDLSEDVILTGACTLCHPLPGGNVIDHILFALTYGQGLAHGIVTKTVNKLIESISLPKEVELIAVCGNPIQLALFTNGEFRDLAFSPDAMKRKGICIPTREGQILDANALGIDTGCDVLVPPSIKAEVGADAIAMISKSGMLQENLAIAIDFGTNAEMAIKSGGSIFVGSAAAGPAIEGQHISHGMLASPGTICDLEYDWGWKCRVLDEQMLPKDGDTVDLAEGKMIRKRSMHAIGIKGTGIIALVSIGLDAGYIDPPRITTDSGKLSLQDGIDFNEEDLLEAGKAFGAMRAGEKTLAARAGVTLDEIGTCFMAGAAGSNADSYKARDVGLIPANTRIVHQLGNTSLEMAADLVSGKETLEGMQKIADRAEHVSFSTSETFKQNYLAEYAYWCEGARYSEKKTGQTVHRPAMKIVKAGENAPKISMKYFQPGYYIPCSKSHERCSQACPKKALLQRDGWFEVDLRRCLGASCLRCELACSGFKLGVNQVEIQKA